MRQLVVFLSLGLAGLQLASCASSKKPTANPPNPGATSRVSLPGTQWVLADLAGTPVLAGGKATLVFPEVGRVAGNGSCNRFSGTVVIGGDTLKMGPLASTRMACIDTDVSQQEDSYLKALGAAIRYAYQEPYLLIYAQGYDKPLRFTLLSPAHP